MTRPRGTIQIRLAQHRALAVAELLRCTVLQEPTALGRAGFTDEQVSKQMSARYQRLHALAAALEPVLRGRPRTVVSLYTLPRDWIEEMQRSIPVLTTPARLKPVVKKIILHTRRKKGPPKYTGSALTRHIAGHRGADERHVRRLRARLRLETAMARQRDMDSNAGRKLSDKPGIQALLAMMVRF